MNDEFPTVSSAWNFSQVGNFFKWDWLREQSGQFTALAEQDEWADYTRAESHTKLLAGVYKVFGVSEFTSRALSAFFGVLLLICIAVATQYYTKNSVITILALFFAIISPYLLEFERYARMYALLLPINLLLIFSAFNLVKEFSKEKPDTGKILILGTLALILFSFAFDLHDLVLISVPPILLFSLFYSYSRNKNFFLFTLGTIIAGSSLFLLFSPIISELNQAFTFLSVLDRQYPFNYSYFFYILDSSIGIIGFILITIWALREFLSEKKDYFYIYLYVLLVLPLLAFIFLVDRFAHPSYIVTLVPLYIILQAISLYNLFNLLKPRIIPLLFLGVLALSTTLISDYPGIYGTKSPYWANYKEGYAPLRDQFDPTKDVLLIQYERFYYLQDLDTKARSFSFGNKDYSKEGENDFYKKLLDTEVAWTTWEKSTAGDIKTSTRNFIEENCENKSLPNTSVYLYRCETKQLLPKIPKDAWKP